MKMAPSAFHYGSKITQHPSYDSSLMLILMPGCHDVCHLTVDVKWIGMITADDQLNHNDACMNFFLCMQHVRPPWRFIAVNEILEKEMDSGRT